ncbi:hypothetical protein SAMN05192561_1011077 [Halopenitus malekzadehii]|uniref:DUF7124 domain-containing protein n=1 Tax=Halopenitus malekzadehii TaxID=1267564 RepID=A0A1H6I4B4_9EURY|nr:hypothetical protein [Halopenitus malekzadehii]SEH43797.1 hypothetical protein SAMN05192561_1011077 [Halopenitus malekzadehii]
MTDTIDLDDLETDDADEPAANHGDWLWREEGTPEDEPETPTPNPSATETSASTSTSGTPGNGGTDTDATDTDATHDGPIPRVPRKNESKPAGVPTDSGGSGAGATVSNAPDDAEPMAAGPHGGGVDDMTMAVTYNAISELADPQLVLVSAREWADWIGIVGDVDAPVITKFQREHGIDADFFNGTGTGPAERLADIGKTSMFYAERLAVVGTPDDEWIAEEAGWEFVPLETAAAEADWDFEEG